MYALSASYTSIKLETHLQLVDKHAKSARFYQYRVYAPTGNSLIGGHGILSRARIRKIFSIKKLLVKAYYSTPFSLLMVLYIDICAVNFLGTVSVFSHSTQLTVKTIED